MPIGPAPMLTVKRPITRERSAAGAARKKIVLCMTEKPAMPMPLNRISASESANERDRAKASTPSRKTSDEPR